MDSRRRLLGGHYTSPSAATPARAGVSLRHGGAAGFAAVRPAVLGLAKLCLIPLASAAPLGIFSRDGSARILESDEDLPKDPGDPSLWIYIGVAIALVLTGGAFAGLTIALMGQGEYRTRAVYNDTRDGTRTLKAPSADPMAQMRPIFKSLLRLEKEPRGNTPLRSSTCSRKASIGFWSRSC